MSVGTQDLFIYIHNVGAYAMVWMGVRLVSVRTESMDVLDRIGVCSVLLVPPSSLLSMISVWDFGLSVSLSQQSDGSTDEISDL